MASVDRWKGNRWRARYRTPDGKSRSKVFDRKIDAEQFLTSMEHRKLTGEYVDPSAGKVTFKSYAEQWRTSQVQHRASTITQVESHLRNHAYPTFGDRPIGSIRPSEIQAWVKERSEHLAPATLEVAYRYLVSVFRAAVDDRVITRNPCVRIKLPKVDKPVVVPMAVEEVDRLRDAMPDRYRSAVTLAAGTGLRVSECLGLTVDRVDFLRRTVRVDRQLVMTGGEGPTFGPPKTGASVRTIPLPVVVGETLAAHLAEYPAGDEGLIFTTKAGGPVRRTRFWDTWRQAVDDAGMPTGLRFHELRHFYASMLIRYGESVKVVQERLGHASAAETLDTYAHLWPDSEDRTRAAVDAVLGRNLDLADAASGDG
ncbi:MAG: site-specific integrase [Acidimicrobiales bacterium]|nr:site-specific integrase [Acidimicrobiales bacterium]